MSQIGFTALLLFVLLSFPVVFILAMIKKGELERYWLLFPAALLAVLVWGFFNVHSVEAQRLELEARAERFYALTLGAGKKWIFLHPVSREPVQSDPRFSFEAMRQLCSQEYDNAKGQYCAAHPDTFGCNF